MKSGMTSSDSKTRGRMKSTGEGAASPFPAFTGRGRSEREWITRRSPQRLRVLLDGRKITHGGIGTYTENLALGLLEGGAEVTVFGDLDQLRSFSWFSDLHAVHETSAPFSADELFFLSKRLPTEQFDLFHTPNYILPFGVRCPSIITVHDLIHVTHPEKRFYPYIAKPLLRSSVKRADSVFVVSNASHREICEMCGEDPRIVQKLKVIPNAVHPFFRQEVESSQKCAKPFGIGKPYFLCVVSNLKPHKGVKDLIQVFHDLERLCEQKLVPESRLVLAGHGSRALVNKDCLMNQVAGLRSVHIVGSVNREELRQLYSGAEALIIPSLAEGFCLPVVEAHAQGVPVITRPIPAVRELLTPYDLVCDDFRASALLNVLRSYLCDGVLSPSRRDGARMAAYLKGQSERFDYRALGRRALDAYRSVIASSDQQTLNEG